MNSKKPRLINADALAHDLEHDVELCARALDDMNVVGKEREDMQFEKDCKQNCIWYISEQPTVDAIPVEWLKANYPIHGVSGTESYFRKAYAVQEILKLWELQNATGKEDEKE